MEWGIFLLKPAALLGALLLDWLAGEPRRFHPLVGFGSVAEKIEIMLNQEGAGRGMGLWALTLLVLPWLVMVLTLTAFLHAFDSAKWLLFIVDLLILYLAIGFKSLREHTMAVYQALEQGDLKEGRHRVSFLVSRRAKGLDEKGVTKATLESLLENGSDAVIASLFWYVILGAPGVVLHRLVNTLDAMWGYKSRRFLKFGWAAARFDDLLGYLPARFCAFCYALASGRRFFRSLSCWRSQAPAWKSPNAGPVMASGAGALGIVLGGEAVYKTGPQLRPILGEGQEPCAKDIQRANALLVRAVMICVVILAVLSLLF